MDARRTLIADSALAVIAERGMRGLSHHAVDAQAGIAKGSTSYYCRKRIDLLALALQRLYDLDSHDLAALAERLENGDRSRLDTATAVAGLIVDWLSETKRRRTIARFELFLAATHEPELHPLLGEQAGAITTIAERIAVAGTERGGMQLALASLMLTEGLMLSVIRLGLPTPELENVVALLMTIAPHHG